MDNEQVYASDTDESDEDFKPEDLADESPVSEDDVEAIESNDELDEDNEKSNKKPVKRKTASKKLYRKTKSKQEDESENDNTNTPMRSTRQKDNFQPNGKGKSLEKDELVSDEEDQTRTNALWADFLKDVNPSETERRVNPSKVENKKSSTDFNGKVAGSKVSNDVKPHINSTPKLEEKKTLITEVLDFAGEDVSIQREIDASSVKENKAATISAAKKQPFNRIMPGAGVKRFATTSATGSSNGVGSLLNQLGKKKKLSVLEKSQMDWKTFKQSEGIDEQLQTFNKGKDGYLERQDFLQRTDLRQFEIEKNLRQSARRPY